MSQPEELQHEDGDRHLGEAIARGDEQAFRTVFENYFDLVFQICYHVCGQSLDAQEAAESVFVEFWRFPNRFHPDRGSLRTYLRIQARCRSIDLVRQRTRQAVGREAARDALNACVEQKERSFDPADQAERRDEDKRVRLVLESLPTEFQSVLKLAFFNSLTHPEIADRLGLPIGTVKSRVRRGLLKFRECFEAAKVAR
ncbi:sigma-70 family RNA polymerase sigma factor [Stieleria sp.]|uniref:sigma-70 family RNA polymerase sigma factor n=1 Tax=Stieleria sp. TaxID=2795976 RepID=UPI0035623818